MEFGYPSPTWSEGQAGEAIPQDEGGFDEPQTISISTAFNPESQPTEPDLIFSSSDYVLFYVDMKTVAKACPPAFQSAISASLPIVPIQETSLVLNVMLHVLYGTSCARHSPAFETLVSAVDHMHLYDISPAAHITASSHTYATLIAFAPIFPLQLYTLAGHHHLYELAVPTSSHLLSYPFSSISDEAAQRMGWLYLKRLFDLHTNRFNALKEMLLRPPYPHSPTRECTFADQTGLTRGWALVSAYLAWDARADLSTHSIKLAFNPLIEELTCQLCRGSMEDNLQDIVERWACVRRTI
ncbi:hypothetical protein BDN72DRAFT_890265 [Pluteus cervinus]|uniref:Uncharacterized protein n=1 Tax=Pluteus cervinus TaxID=181527 RepID=A0ACD3A5G5_9AGAR|nr:hypothetical protein BDN72DRAFT_890265 [Pluteus cervinus]